MRGQKKKTVLQVLVEYFSFSISFRLCYMFYTLLNKLEDLPFSKFWWNVLASLFHLGFAMFYRLLDKVEELLPLQRIQKLELNNQFQLNEAHKKKKNRSPIFGGILQLLCFIQAFAMFYRLLDKHEELLLRKLIVQSTLQRIQKLLDIKVKN